MTSKVLVRLENRKQTGLEVDITHNGIGKGMDFQILYWVFDHEFIDDVTRLYCTVYFGHGQEAGQWGYMYT